MILFIAYTASFMVGVWTFVTHVNHFIEEVAWSKTHGGKWKPFTVLCDALFDILLCAYFLWHAIQAVR